MAASSVSPSSSPRLPSPPPIAEVQLGPQSPGVATEEQQKLFSSLDHGAVRRIRAGTKADDMAEGPPLVDLAEIDSAFQLTEHLKALHNFLTHPIGSNHIVPVDRHMAHKLAQPPEGVEKTLWLYELCRFLTQKINSIVITLFADNPPCSSITCPEMRASEWQYLCAVHDPPKSCSAIDYCCHTLDWAANLLTSPKVFPSRLAMGADQATQEKQMRHMTNIFRRVYRIFAHAWFQHRDMFWKAEGRSGLYVMFKVVCDVYGLIPDDNYTIPSEAEGADSSNESSSGMPPLILKREPSGPAPQESDNPASEGVSDHTLSTAGTTKRHRHSPSVGATAVSTVVEESEEDDEQSKQDSSVPQAPQLEKTTEDPDPVADEISPVETPKIGSTADEAEEADGVAPDDSQPAEETEKSTSSEGDQTKAEPEEDEKEAGAAGDQSAEADKSEMKEEEDKSDPAKSASKPEREPEPEPEPEPKAEDADPATSEKKETDEPAAEAETPAPGGKGSEEEKKNAEEPGQ